MAQGRHATKGLGTEISDVLRFRSCVRHVHSPTLSSFSGKNVDLCTVGCPRSKKQTLTPFRFQDNPKLVTVQAVVEESTKGCHEHGQVSTCSADFSGSVLNLLQGTCCLSCSATSFGPAWVRVGIAYCGGWPNDGKAHSTGGIRTYMTVYFGRCKT
jgi:hypothetical protein